VTGLDPSPACAAAAARLYSIDVRTMTLGEIAMTGEQFNCVIMVGVLEHLRDLDHAFDHLRALLSPAGLLYVEVPDVTAFADWPNAPYQDFSTEHINFFSPISLDNLMRRHGFTRVFLEQNHREQSYRTVMSNVSAVYRREDVSPPGQMQFDRDTARGLERYLSQCATDDEALRAHPGSRGAQGPSRTGVDQLSRVREGDCRTDPPRPRMLERADPSLQCLRSAQSRC
jgi:SAM-dependent methyltransferase